MHVASCEKCKATNVAGSRYGFHYGKVLKVKQGIDVEQTAVKVSTNVNYKIDSSEEVFICDRCMAGTVARNQVEGAIFLICFSAFGTLLCLALAYGASWWWLIGVVICGSIGVIPVLTLRDVASLRHALADPSVADLLALPQINRLLPPDKTALQDIGDHQAAGLRKEALMKNGFDLFLTRKTYDKAMEAAANNTEFDILLFQESGPGRRKLAPVAGVVVGIAAGVGFVFLRHYLSSEGHIEPVIWLWAIFIALSAGFFAFAAVRWIR